MPKIIIAVYEKGVFKPLEKVDLRDGERVRIEIKESLADVIEKYSRKVEKDILKEFLEERR